tara:strand:- start:755 stop:1252 length:498 start_codon:yes stop_codon:yes gene_type:complete
MIWVWHLDCPGICPPPSSNPDGPNASPGVCAPSGKAYGHKTRTYDLFKERRRDLPAADQAYLKACWKEGKEKFLDCIYGSYGWTDLVPPEFFTTPPSNPSSKCECTYDTEDLTTQNYRYPSLNSNAFINSTRFESGHANYKEEQASEALRMKMLISQGTGNSTSW